MGKESKKSKKSSDKKADAMIVDSVAEITPAVNYLQTVIAHPLASSKLTKKLLKTVKKAAQDKKVRRGVKEVSKGLRKGEKGIVIIAGNISPIDVISHLPVLCEDHDIQYVFVPSKEDLGTAGSTKRPTSVVLISDKCEGGAQESLVECKSEMKKLAYVK